MNISYNRVEPGPHLEEWRGPECEVAGSVAWTRVSGCWFWKFYIFDRVLSLNCIRWG